jgi:hypothetical protein
LLGAVLANAGCDVLMTEVEQAMPHLNHNVECNQPAPPGWLKSSRLVWDDSADIAEVWRVAGPDLEARGFDGIVATDVIFEVALVPPLLRTMHRMVSSAGVVFVCVQVSHCAAVSGIFLIFFSVCL